MPDGKEGDPQPKENVEDTEVLENEEDIVFSDDEKDTLGEETSKKVDSLSAQKKHWREKHKKEAEEFEAYKKANPEKAPEDKPPVEKKPKDKKSSNDEDMEAMKAENQEIKLKLNNPDLSMEQIKKGIAYAKAEGKDTQEFIESDYFKAYLKVESDKLAEKKSSLPPSNRNGSGETDFAKVTEEDIKAMDSDTYKKYQEYQLKEEGTSGDGIKIVKRVNM